MGERRAIFARYTTAWAQRSRRDNFVLNEEPRFDPEEYRDAMVFRVGGEEFCVVMPGLAQGDAVAVAERLRSAVAQSRFRVPLRISIGLAAYPDDGTTREELLGHADTALYAAKGAGKNRTSAYADLELSAGSAA